jgi:hypothetical protein
MHLPIRPNLVFGVVALALLFSAGRAAAQQKLGHLISLHVETVIATDTHQGMDPKLERSPAAKRLRAIFDYTTYRLLRHQDENTRCGLPVAFNLPGGRILHVSPTTVEGNMIVMEMVLFAGAEPVMRTELEMTNGGSLMLVGPRVPGQTYIVTIGAETDAPVGRDLHDAAAPASHPSATNAALSPSPAPPQN